MDDDRRVYPADDSNFSDFKRLCEESKGWTTCYDKKNIVVSTKNHGNSNIKVLKAITSFDDVSAATIFDVLHDVDYRKKWDHDMIEMKEICKLCVNNTVSYYAVKCPTPVKSRDVVFLCSWIAYPSMRNPTEYIMINRSVSHAQYPPKSSMVRAISVITGYLIRPTSEKSVELLYLTQFDPRGSLPKWVVNKVAQFFTPKTIHRIHKAARKYNAWKKNHAPNYKPWLYPGQARLATAHPDDLSTRIDDVDYIDESGVIEDKEMNGKDADLSDDEN